MTFELLPVADTFHADFLRRGSSIVVVARVGRDRERRTQYFAQVWLETVPGCTHLEYGFDLVGVSSGHEEFYKSGLDTPKTISRDDRRGILNILCSMTEALLNHVKPDEVMRITHDAYPENDHGSAALEKHHTVSVVFERCGYEVGTTDVYMGKRIWMMKRGTSSST